MWCLAYHGCSCFDNYMDATALSAYPRFVVLAMQAVPGAQKT